MADYYGGEGYQSEGSAKQSNPPPYNPNAYSAHSQQPNISAKQPLVSSPPTSEQTRFKSSNYRDVIWAVAFLINVITICVLSIFYYSKNESTFHDNHTGFVNKAFWPLLLIVCVIACIAATFWLLFMYRFAACFIWFSLFLSVSIFVICGIVAFAASSVIFGIFCFVIAAVQLLWIYCVRHRILFASVVLCMSVEAVSHFKSIFIVSILSVAVQTLWCLIWTLGFAFVIYNGTKQTDANGNNIQSGVVFIFVLSFYWTAQVIANVCHVSTSGVVASWYYLFPHHCPSNVVAASFRRATTYSFGSICFGSFLIAVIQAVKFMVHSAKKQKNDIVRCCVECILQCVEDILNYFNFYAFTRVAIYGDSYCVAAKQTWQLFKSKGFDIIINDDIIDIALSTAALFAGGLSALITIIICIAFMKDVNQWEAWAAIAFVLGYVVSLCSLIVIRSGCATLFVCFAEDPASLSFTKPSSYEAIVTAWKQRYGKLPARLTNPV